MEFASWTHAADVAHASRILPDGCRDVILRAETGAIDVTGLDLAPRAILIPAGSRMQGYRLRPGAWIDPRDLTGPDLSGSVTAAHAVAGLIRYDPEVGEAIAALAEDGATVAAVARRAGMTERTLQRRFAREGLPPPAFWRLLGRARRAVPLIGGAAPLADVAAEAGYADQAHMTREFRRWFGLTPRRLAADARARADLAQPGLGNWMGEQISIR